MSYSSLGDVNSLLGGEPTKEKVIEEDKKIEDVVIEEAVKNTESEDDLGNSSSDRFIQSIIDYLGNGHEIETITTVITKKSKDELDRSLTLDEVEKIASYAKTMGYDESEFEDSLLEKQ